MKTKLLIIPLFVIVFVLIQPAFAESTITPISITSDTYVYEKNQTLIISINNEDSSKNAIFNFSILDPNGKNFKDDCISHENPQGDTIRPFSTVEITWNTKDCKNKVIEGNWKIISHLTSENKLTDLTTSVEIKIVEDIVKYNSPPPNLDFQNEIFHGSITQSNGTSGNYVVMTKYTKYNIPYEITNGTINKITVYCKGRSLDVDIIPNGEGKLVIKIPKELMYSINLVYGSNTNLKNAVYDDHVFTIWFLPEARKLVFSAGDPFTSNLEICRKINNPPYSYILSPLKQMKNGVASIGVICKEGLEIVVRAEKETPACVKLDTATKLIQRGWTSSDAYTVNLAGGVDLDPNQDDSLKQEILAQLRKVPKNLTDNAKEFILSEALSDKRVSDLLGDSKYQTFWTVNSELGESSIKYYYGITFQLNEKDEVNVVYDLQEEKITSVELGEVFGSSSAEEIPSDLFNRNQTNSIPLTLFPVTPQNVTLPDTTKQTQTFADRISINKINQLKIINSDSTNGQKTHLAQLSINSVTLHTTDIENLPAKPGFDTLIFDYTIQSKDNDAFYAMLDFEVQVGSKKYPTLLNGGDFSEILLPDEKRDSYFAIQIGKDANQVILNVRDPITQKTLWSIPVDLKPFNIKYKPEEGILIQENED